MLFRSEENSEHYHRIETVVTTTASSSEGTPIEALGYSNRIQTVESIRVIGRGPRRASGAAARAGGAWYEEEEFMEAPLPHHPGDHTPEAPGIDFVLSKLASFSIINLSVASKFASEL